MVMMGLEFADDIPFADVYVHSVIQAPDGRRMSKSLGTGIDPLDEIDEHGADAVRFGLLAMSSTQDVCFNEDKVAQGSQLANKLWNASRLVLLRAPEDLPEPRAATVEDAWILSRLQRAKAATERAFETFEFHRAVLGLYDFVYGDLCDWYLELIKPRLYADDNAGVSAVALHVLSETLALAHPVIPFVTEEIWSFVPGAEGLLMAQPFPAADESLIDDAAEAEIARAIEAVQGLRTWRDRVGAAPIPSRQVRSACTAAIARPTSASASGSVSNSSAAGHLRPINSPSAPGTCDQISSVTNGITGCAIASVSASTPSAKRATASLSSSYSRGLTISRYQSHSSP